MWNTCRGDSESKRAFRVQKRVIQIFSGANKCKSCRKILKDYRILTVTSLYILEVLCYIKCIKVIRNNTKLLMVITLEVKLTFMCSFAVQFHLKEVW